MRSYLFRISLFVVPVLLMGQGCLSLTNDESTSGPGGVFLSTDQGETWSQASTYPTEEGVQTLSSLSVYRLFEDPQDPDAMYWASRSNGLFFTYDNARTWQRARGTLSKGFIYSVQVHPDDKCLLYATTGQRVYRSDDCSRSWEQIYKEDRSNARIASLLIARDEPRTIYMAKINGDLLRSVDGGFNWSVAKRFKCCVLADMYNDAVNSNIIYVATRETGLIRTKDGGVTWERIIDPIDRFSKAIEYRSMLPHAAKEGVLYWVSTYGIIKTEDAGDTWDRYKLVTSPGSVSIYGFAVNPQNDNELYYATFNNNRSTFYRSNDNGQTWSTENLPSGQVPTVLRVHPENGTLFLGLTIPPKQ